MAARWPVNHATAALRTPITICPLNYAKWRRNAYRSSDFGSTFSSSCCRCCAEDNFSVNWRKAVRKSIDTVASESDSRINEGFNSSTNRSFGDFALRNGKSLSLKKWLFGKRALWRRIFFVSKRVRSIILLNFLTIIYGIELGFWVSLGYINQALGLLTSDAGRSSFISMFTVIIVPLIDGMLGSVVPARTWFGALISIIGIAMLEFSGSPPCIGDLLNFVSAVFFGIHMIRAEHISRRTKRENFLPLLGYEVCTVALLSTIWYFVGGWFGNGFQESNPLTWTLASVFNYILEFPWMPALYTGIFSTGLCLWIERLALNSGFRFGIGLKIWVQICHWK